MNKYLWEFGATTIHDSTILVEAQTKEQAEKKFNAGNFYSITHNNIIDWSNYNEPVQLEGDNN